MTVEFPIVDVRTGQITGCEEGSKEYEHEKAHIEFAQTNKGQTMQWISEMALFYTVIFLVTAQFISVFRWLSAGTAAIMLYCFVYEELFCNK